MTTNVHAGAVLPVCVCLLTLMLASSCQTTSGHMALSDKRSVVFEQTRIAVAQMAEENIRWRENPKQGGRPNAEISFQRLLVEKDLVLEALLEHFAAERVGTGELSVMSCLLSGYFADDLAIQKAVRLFGLPSKEARFHAYEAVAMMLLENERRYENTPARDRLRQDVLQVLKHNVTIETDEKAMLSLKGCQLVFETEDSGLGAQSLVLRQNPANSRSSTP